jgi:hypothetical protein
MHHKRISNADWKIKEEKFEKKLSWKGKMLSYGGRLILLNSVLLCFRSMRPQKVCYKNLTFIDRGFFGKVMIIKRNIGLLNERLSIDPRMRGSRSVEFGNT